MWAGTGALFSASLAFGAQLQVEVRVNVERGCQLVGLTREAGIDSVGVLDFGSTARLDNASGPLGAALANERLARLECNPDTLYQVQIDGGQHGGVGDVRYLAARQDGGKPIPYRLFRDAARRIPLPVNEPVSGRVPASGSVDLPFFARIEPLAEVPRVGGYSDVLKVTVSW